MNESGNLCLKFRANPNIHLKLDYIFGKPMKRIDSNDILWLCMEIGYCQLFTHESNRPYISVWKIRHSAHSNQWGRKCWKIPKTAPSYLGTWTPSNTWMPGPTPLTTPNDSSISSPVPHNYATKSPLVTMGCPKFTHKTATSPSAIITPIWYTHSSTDPTHHPKRHPDPFSHFATVYFPDWQTDQPTDTLGLGNRSVAWALTLTI